MDWEPFVRVGLAALLAVPIGLDRELRGKAAGLRTHVVVAAAAAALGYVSILAAAGGGRGADQTRIASEVVSGIGFMGAGVIFAAGGRVHGLTTAAALWGAAAVGLVTGLGSEALALALVLVTVLFLAPVDWLMERTVQRFANEDRVVTVVVGGIGDLDAVQRVVESGGGSVRSTSVSSLADGVAARFVLNCKLPELRAVGEQLAATPQVRFSSTSATETS